MTRTITSYQARRHPFLFGVFVLILSPYILGFALIYAAAYLAVAAAGALGRR